MKLQDIINHITESLEIEDRLPDSNEVYSFSFEKDIDIEIFQLNNKKHIFLGNIYTLDYGSSTSNVIIDECAKLAISVFKTKRTVIYIDDDNISLYNIVSNEQPSMDVFVKCMKDFVYDMSWWKQKVGSYLQVNVSQNNNMATWLPG